VAKNLLPDRKKDKSKSKRAWTSDEFATFRATVGLFAIPSTFGYLSAGIDNDSQPLP